MQVSLSRSAASCLTFRRSRPDLENRRKSPKGHHSKTGAIATRSGSNPVRRAIDCPFAPSTEDKLSSAYRMDFRFNGSTNLRQR